MPFTLDTETQKSTLTVRAGYRPVDAKIGADCRGRGVVLAAAVAGGRVAVAVSTVDSE